MGELGALFLRAMFAENMPLTYFLGLCTFLALSRRTDTAFGLGVAVIVVMGVTVPLNQLIYSAVLAPGAWAWAGMPEVDLSYLSLLTFIGVEAIAVVAFGVSWLTKGKGFRRDRSEPPRLRPLHTIRMVRARMATAYRA